VNPNTLLLPHVWPRAERPTVNHCALLAVLLQVWLVLTFGNAPGGSARPGEGVWGAVNVTLRGPERAGEPAPALPPLPAVATGPVGSAPSERWGGAVREQVPSPATPEPGSARLGDWAPLATVPLAVPEAAAPAAALPLATTALPAVAQPGEVARAARRLESSLPAPRTPTTPPLSAVVPAPTPTSLPELSAPSAQPLMALRAAPPRPAAPVAGLSSSAAPAAALPELAQQLPVPSAVPQAPLATLSTLAPSPAALTADQTAPLGRAEQPALSRPEAVASPLPPTATLNAGPIASTPTAAAGGAPDAGTQLGHDIATAPSPAASAPPRLNLQLARQRGGELSRGMGGGLLAVMPRPPEVDDKLGQQIRKAAKSDCRQAYAAAGLLAVVPLAMDAVKREGGCKW
jgi:hypothetical protein